MVLRRRLDRGIALKRTRRFALIPCAALALACASAPQRQPGERTILLSEESGIPSAGGMAPRPTVLSTRADDERVGEEAAREVESALGLLGDAQLDAYLTRVGERLLRGIPRVGTRYRFSVVDQVEPNAFALPGGHIYVSRGLLALIDDEDELANVLGHEIVHAASRHAAAQQAVAMSQNPLATPWVRAANLAAYSRDMERDADRGGQLLAAAAGYDPMGMSTLMANLELAQRLETGPRSPSFLDSHPGPVERASINAVRANEIRWHRDASQGDLRQAYLDAVEGLPLGARPEAGVFEGTLFLHPALGFQIRFPDGWRLQNTNRAVGAMSPQRDGLVYLTADLPPGPTREVAEAFLARELQGRFRVLDAQPVKLGALPAWRIELDAPSPFGSVYVLSTFFPFRDGTWRITGLAPAASAGAQRGRMLATTRSFRPIDRARAAGIRATRLHVVRARADEGIEALSARTGNRWSALRTAIFNGIPTDHRFTGGERVKIAAETDAGAGDARSD